MVLAKALYDSKGVRLWYDQCTFPNIIVDPDMILDYMDDIKAA